MNRQIVWCAAGTLFLLACAAAISEVDATRQAVNPISTAICSSGD
jgi:hypothetical protein